MRHYLIHYTLTDTYDFIAADDDIAACSNIMSGDDTKVVIITEQQSIELITLLERISDDYYGLDILDNNNKSLSGFSNTRAYDDMYHNRKKKVFELASRSSMNIVDVAEITGRLKSYKTINDCINSLFN